MRHFALVSLIIALVSQAAAQVDYIPAEPLHDAKLIRQWQLQLPLEGRVVENAYFVEDHLYIATQDAWVFCVHADTGVLRWVQQVNKGGYPVWRPTHAGDRVIFTSPATIRQYDRIFGDPIREIQLRFPAGSPGISDGTHIYVGGTDRRMYCFDINWDYEIWKVGTNGIIGGTGILFGTNRGALAFPSEDGGIYACRTSDKSQLWQKKAAGPVTADLAVDENGIFVACRDQSLYLLEPSRGDARWRARFSGPLTEAPVLTKEFAYQFSVDDGLCAVATAPNVEGERIRWKLPQGRQLLTADKQSAYVLSRDSEILVVKIEDGSITHIIPAHGFGFGMPRSTDQTIHLASADGRLLCLRPSDAPPLNPASMREALQRKRPGESPASRPASAPVAEATKPVPGLDSKSVDKPVGGKSKVSKSYGGG